MLASFDLLCRIKERGRDHVTERGQDREEWGERQVGKGPDGMGEQRACIQERQGVGEERMGE